MKNVACFVLACGVVLSLALTGCAVPASDEDDVGEARSAIDPQDCFDKRLADTKKCIKIVNEADFQACQAKAEADFDKCLEDAANTPIETDDNIVTPGETPGGGYHPGFTPPDDVVVP